MNKRISYIGMKGTLYQRVGTDSFEPTLTFLSGIRSTHPGVVTIDIDVETPMGWINVVSIYVD